LWNTVETGQGFDPGHGRTPFGLTITTHSRKLGRMAIKQHRQKALPAADLMKRIRKLEASQSKHASVIIRLVKKLKSMKPLSKRLKRQIGLLRDPGRRQAIYPFRSI
jgi:hypothetical protein